MRKHAGAVLGAIASVVGLSAPPAGAAPGHVQGALVIEIQLSNGINDPLVPTGYTFTNDPVTGAAAFNVLGSAYAGPLNGSVSGGGSSTLIQGSGTLSGSVTGSVGVLWGGGIQLLSASYVHVGAVIVLTGPATFHSCISTQLCASSNGTLTFAGVLAATVYTIPVGVTEVTAAGPFIAAGL